VLLYGLLAVTKISTEKHLIRKVFPVSNTIFMGRNNFYYSRYNTFFLGIDLGLSRKSVCACT
jgi:hypothetical protein